MQAGGNHTVCEVQPLVHVLQTSTLDLACMGMKHREGESQVRGWVVGRVKGAERSGRGENQGGGDSKGQ